MCTLTRRCARLSPPATAVISTSSAVLLEAIRSGAAPAAIINASADPIVALGSIVADELYGRCVPVVVLPPEAYGAIREGDRVAVEPDGTVWVG